MYAPDASSNHRVITHFSCHNLQGKQKQQKRTTTFFEFCNAESGTLLCTDVAARGLDIPRVDWIIQYDPPDDPRDYIHRVGRTARAGKVGKSLMFLLPSELGFLRFLKEAKVPLNEFSFPADKIANVQSQVNYFIHSTRVVCDGATRVRDADISFSFFQKNVAGKTLAEELLFASVGTRWLPVVSASICIIFAEEDLRCQSARLGQSRQVIWLRSSPTREREHWGWHGWRRTVREEAEAR